MTTETNQSEFPFAVDASPDYSLLTVKVPAEKSVRVEASSMASMTSNMQMKTKLKGGFKRFLTGESIFINEFTASHSPGEISIAPGSPGEVRHIYLENKTIYLQNSAFLASSTGVTVETKWQGLVKGFFSGESLFLIKCSGNGDLWFNSYGGILEIDVTESYVVDTGAIVAFTDGLSYDVKPIGGYKSLFFSGEGLVCRFHGKGKVWIQTRQASALAHWVWPFRPQKSNN